MTLAWFMMNDGNEKDVISLDYQRGKPVGWEAVTSLTMRLEKGSILISGSCPRCGHPIHGELKEAKGVPAFAPRRSVARNARSESKPTLPIDVHISCKCEYFHASAPAGAIGCGACGGVHIAADGEVTAIELSPEQRRAAAWVDQIVEERLPNIRELATQWGATVTAITALLGAGTIISSDDVMATTASSKFTAVSYGLLVVAALIVAAKSILEAARASQRKVGDIPKSVDDRVKFRQDTIERAEQELGTSRLLAAWAGGLILVAVMARWLILRY